MIDIYPTSKNTKIQKMLYLFLEKIKKIKQISNLKKKIEKSMLLNNNDNNKIINTKLKQT